MFLSKSIQLVILGFIILKYNVVNSQITFENIKNFRTENFGSFLNEDKEITGYYLLNSNSEFYDKNAVFHLSLLDSNFNKKTVIDISLFRNSGLVDVVANNNAIMLFFVSNKGYDLLTYSKSGEKLGSKFIPKKEINKAEYDYVYVNTNKEISFYYLS